MSIDNSILDEYDATDPSVSANALAQLASADQFHRELKRFLKFGMVGATGAIVDYGILNLLVFGAGWSSPVGMAMANVLSTSAAILNNFIWNRRWTFSEARTENGARQFLQFVTVSLVGLLLGSFIFVLANQYVYRHLLSEVLAVQASKATAIGLVMFWNFAANRLWTFRTNRLD